MLPLYPMAARIKVRMPNSMLEWLKPNRATHETEPKAQKPKRNRFRKPPTSEIELKKGLKIPETRKEIEMA